tara:strand:- start:437 stop:1261 length:825 start_codon:yes stop_codon:yes gene_type:complete
MGEEVEINEIDIPYLIKNVVHRITHPKKYKDMIQDYIKRVGERGDKLQSNGSILFDIARDHGLSRARPLMDYINKLVSKGKLPKELKAEFKFTEFRNFNYKPLLNEKIEALVKKSKESGISYSTLKKVYDRGMGAYKTNPQSVRPNVTSPQQWALARVNSFIKRGHKQDDDLREDIKVNSWGEITEKDDKSGKELNNPTRGDTKKYKVYVKNDKGNVVKVEFGDPNMEIKRDDPARRKAFRARHNCDNPGPKWKAKYWSCKFWSAKSVTDLMKG